MHPASVSAFKTFGALLAARGARAFMASPTLCLSPATHTPMLRPAACWTSQRPHTSSSLLHSTAIGTRSLTTNGTTGPNADAFAISAQADTNGTVKSITGGFAALGQLSSQQAADAARYQHCVEAVGVATRDRKHRLGGLVLCFGLFSGVAFVHGALLSADPMEKLRGMVDRVVTALEKDLKQVKASNNDASNAALLALAAVVFSCTFAASVIAAPFYVTCLVVASRSWAWFWQAQSRTVTARHSLEELKSSCKLMWGHEYVWRLEKLFGK